jgi:hypothetical protein
VFVAHSIVELVHHYVVSGEPIIYRRHDGTDHPLHLRIPVSEASDRCMCVQPPVNVQCTCYGDARFIVLAM